jgi:predicted lipoprotein with Yx(FWY)xxD motif
MNLRKTGYLLSLALAAIAPACSSNNNTSTDAPAASDASTIDAPAGATAATLTATTDALGARLVDKDGKALYFYVKDVAGTTTSACTGACLTTWPAADLGATTTVGAGLTASDFASITTNGAAQTTWKGRPLYHYAPDGAGTTPTGEAVGKLWFVARAYNLFYGSNASVTPSGGAAGDNFLTDGKGHTLYIFENDTRGVGATPPVNMCTGGCATVWPLWAVPATLTTFTVPSTIAAGSLTAFTAGSAQQFAYKGQPTYFYAPGTPAMQEAPGAVGGVAIAKWHAVSAAFSGTF